MAFTITDLTKGGERRTAETLEALGPAKLALLDGPVFVTLATLRKSGTAAAFSNLHAAATRSTSTSTRPRGARRTATSKPGPTSL